MTMTDQRSTIAPQLPAIRRLLLPLPFAVYLVAAAAALIPLTSIWHSQMQAADGWRFTGNVSVSPDLTQYRSWMRQAEETGMLVDNRFTAEPNQPYIPVPLYFAVGKIAQWTGAEPEFVYVYAGAVLSFLFALLLFATVRMFFDVKQQVWWIFLMLLLGGGLGAHLKVISGVDFVRNSRMLRMFLVDPIWAWPLFEDYRSHYIFVTLFDPHFIFIWLLALASVVALYLTLDEFTIPRLLTTAALFAISSFVHFYEGPLLLLMTACVGLLLWQKGLQLRSWLVTLIVCTVAVAASNLLQVLLYRMYGLPASWASFYSVLVSTLLISYPIGWIPFAFGLGAYWRGARLKECFLLGWLLGCLVWTLSGPFNPFPDRGTMTMQIPIYLIAGAIYFSRWPRVMPLVAAAVVLTLGVTPLWMTAKRWKESYFTSTEPYKFLGPEHQEILKTLRERGSRRDVLLADESDLLWLGAEYSGRHYCGHWFLCVDYDKKKEERARFFAGSAADKATFVTRENIRFVFVDPANHPDRFAGVSNLALVKATSIGSLFERTPADSARVVDGREGIGAVR
jgi:hypothetical protein